MNQRFVAVLLSFASASGHAALLGRVPATPDGIDYQAYYDTSLNITWLADANYAQTSDYLSQLDNGQCCTMTWLESQDWIAFLNSSGHLGVDHWRLPTAAPVNEMDNLYFDTLGNTENSPGGSGFTNTGPFLNLYSGDWWTGTLESGGQWAADFWFGGGLTGNGRIDTSYKHAWAVADGDIAAVPLPASAWLIASAFSLMAPWFRSRCRQPAN